MAGFAFLMLAGFIAERAHQWQSLMSRDWSVEWKGRRIPRPAFLLTTLVICWGEGLGFYVQSERAFWAMIFWVLAAHVILTGGSRLRRSTPALRRIGPSVFAIAALSALLRNGASGGGGTPSWLGHSLLPRLPDLPAVLIAAVACLASTVLLVKSPSRALGREFLFGSTLWALLTAALIPAGPGAMVVFVLGVHAGPCLFRNSSAVHGSRRVTGLLLAGFLALAEWFVVARSISFPWTIDLGDWWDLGDGTYFLVHPIWMAPFLAHVVIDAIRFVAPPPEAS